MTPGWIKGVLLLGVTFAAGVVAGVGYERWHPAAHATTTADAHEAMHRLILDLDLDAVQQQAISQIFERRQKDIDAAWHEMAPHVRTTLDSAHDEILAVLHPDQAEKFRKMIQRMHPAGHR